ncbi:MAG: archaetidylserine decarboxylase [Bdellovibrionota bacterium]
MSPLAFILRIVPKNLASYLTGKIAYLPLPSFVLTPLLQLYCRTYGVRIEEASKPLNQYRSLGDFFIRDLIPGARPIADGIVSPVDADLTQFGSISAGTLLQVKGKTFELGPLLDDQSLASTFRDGFFITLYLAPGDYHHVHSPVDGTITDSYHLPGDLWPVNRWSTENVQGLFCENERLVTLIQTANGRVAVIKVGAFNVGSIAPTYDSFRTNTFSRIIDKSSVIRHRTYTPPIGVRRGERLATFRLGSTVILLFEKSCFAPCSRCMQGPIQLGQPLGHGAEGCSTEVEGGSA